MATRKKAARRKKATAQSARKRKRGSLRPARKKTGGRGKPKIDFDLGDLEELAKVGNSNRTIARLMHVAESVLQERIADTPEVSEAIANGRAHMENELRSAQFKLAVGDPDEGIQPNPTMLIWRGKQDLGQRDVRAVELTGGEGGPVSFMADLAPVLEQKLVEFLRNRKAAEADSP